MDEITKNKIKRFLRSYGLEIKNPKYSRTLYSRANFSSLGDCPTIFDVGANIGQSAIEFRHSFKSPLIYAFEPVSSVYQTLVSNTKKLKNIHTYKLGMGQANAKVKIPKVSSKTIQTTQVLSDFGEINDETETIQITTIDDFCAAENIHSIDILKTDTEGFDLDVCKGMKRMLESQNVSYIVTEVSLDFHDKQHTNLYDLRDYLLPLGYELVSLFDLHYGQASHLDYFNAIFSSEA